MSGPLSLLKLNADEKKRKEWVDKEWQRLKKETSERAADRQRETERVRAEEFEAAAAKAAAEIESKRQKLLATWRRNGGAEAEFETAWPQIKRDMILQRNGTSDDDARAAHRRVFRGI